MGLRTSQLPGNLVQFAAQNGLDQIGVPAGAQTTYRCRNLHRMPGPRPIAAERCSDPEMQNGVLTICSRPGVLLVASCQSPAKGSVQRHARRRSERDRGGHSGLRGGTRYPLPVRSPSSASQNVRRVFVSAISIGSTYAVGARGTAVAATAQNPVTPRNKLSTPILWRNRCWDFQKAKPSRVPQITLSTPWAIALCPKPRRTIQNATHL